MNDVERNRRDGKRRNCNGEKSSVTESNIQNDCSLAKLSQFFLNLPPLPVERATRFDQPTNDIYTVKLSMLKASSLSSVLSAQGFK